MTTAMDTVAAASCENMSWPTAAVFIAGIAAAAVIAWAIFR